MTDNKILRCEEYEIAAAAFAHEAVDAAMCEADSLFAAIERKRIPENVSSISVDVAGSSTDSPFVNLRSELVVADADVVSGNYEDFHNAIEKVASDYLSTFMPAFIEHMGDAVEAVGSSVDLSGQPLGWERLLDLMEQVEWSVDLEGIARPPSIAWGRSGSVEDFLGPQDANQRERWAKIIIRKQVEVASRRRSRRLR